MMTAATLNETKIVQDYDLGDTMSTISNRYNTTITFVHDILRKHKVQTQPFPDVKVSAKTEQIRKPLDKTNVDEQQIIQEYQKGETVTKISLTHKINTVAVRAILVDHNIELRKSHKGRMPKEPKHLDELQIVKEYKKGDGLIKIANKHGSIPPTIRTILVRNNITIRPPGKSPKD